jgi:galactosylceramidase
MALPLALCMGALAQSITLDGTAGGKLYEGIGAVSGGGATSAILKDYPEPQRSQILDLLFKPNFGASMQALYVEVGGDGNSTQGSELSHMHSRTDENYGRGYEWWLMSEAVKRNPAITLDGAAWSAPGWIGNGNFWSQDMADYYTKWIRGLKANYGLTMNTIGCRNEKGVNEAWVKTFRTTLDNAGLTGVRIHAFDNWGTTKWDWVGDMNNDATLRSAVAIISNHTMSEVPATASVQQWSNQWNKPIWNTEEHPYTTGFNGALEVVHDFNINYVQSHVTKIINWYLENSTYSVEPQYNIDAPVQASSPWSGHYSVVPKIWAYAHYGQFSAIGWTYLNGGSGNLGSKGTYVTLANGADYSVIVETQGAGGTQTLNLSVKGGLSTGKVHVWRSNSTAQFVPQTDITPTNGAYSISLEANSIYTLTTTTGQQKGGFAGVPAAAAFPFPYYETFDHYSDAKAWGYQPHYFADIDGGFEIAANPSGTGKCVRQVVSQQAQSWAPEWYPYTIFGDPTWNNYEVSADVYLDDGGWAGVMGRVSSTGSGYGCNPTGYYMRLDGAGNASLWTEPGKQISSGKASGVAGNQWHNVKIQFNGTTITGFVDRVQVFKVTDNTFSSGLAGLATGGDNGARNTAYFDNLLVNTVNGATPAPTVFAQDANPIYGGSTGISRQRNVEPVPALGKMSMVGEILQLNLPGWTQASIEIFSLDGRKLGSLQTELFDGQANLHLGKVAGSGVRELRVAGDGGRLNQQIVLP